MDGNALVRSIQESAEKVFKSMFAMEVEYNGFDRKSELQGGDEILSIIGIRGDLKGSFMFVCDPIGLPPRFNHAGRRDYRSRQ